MPLSPFEKKIKAMNRMLENGGNMSDALRAAGYSENYAHSGRFAKTKTYKTYKELLNQYIPDTMIAEKHAEMMNATKLEHGVFPMLMDDTLIFELLMQTGCLVTKIVEIMGQKHVWYRAPDQQARKNAMDMAYKCKDHYAAEKFEDVTPLRKLSNEELAQKRKELIKMLLKK